MDGGLRRGSPEGLTSKGFWNKPCVGGCKLLSIMFQMFEIQVINLKLIFYELQGCLNNVNIIKWIFKMLSYSKFYADFESVFHFFKYCGNYEFSSRSNESVRYRTKVYATLPNRTEPNGTEPNRIFLKKPEPNSNRTRTKPEPN